MAQEVSALSARNGGSVGFYDLNPKGLESERDRYCSFTMQPEFAIKNLRAFLDLAAVERVRTLGCHGAYPAAGCAERKGGAYRFITVGGLRR